MRSIASALFGVLATVGGVPIIRALPGGPTQMISEQLSKVHNISVFFKALLGLQRENTPTENDVMVFGASAARGSSGLNG